MLKKIFGILLFSIVLVSCGNRNTTRGIVTKDAEAVSVIQNHYNNEADFKTVSGKLRAVYQDDEKTQSVNLSYRMEKDKAIWMSASVLGFPIAKAYITPTSVQYYEKISQSYFDGDFSLLSDWLGTPLDFQKLQNLLIGQAIYDLRLEAYTFSQSPRGFQFVSDDAGAVKRMFLLSPSTFKASAQQLAQDSENRSVTVTYSEFQNISGVLFPDEIKIIANEAGSSTNIELTYRSVEFNEQVSFPFDIPSGYEEIMVR